MSNDFESNLGGKTGGVDNDSDKDDGKQASAQSSDCKSSMPPNTSDDITSDECKPPSFQAKDGEHSEVQIVARRPTALHRNMTKSFAMQIMDMLNSEAEAGGEAVQWLPDGSGFIIKRQNEFEQQILPRFFDSPCIFQSFTRRLYRWGFKQINKSASGSGIYVFTNEVFRRDRDVYLTMKPLPRHKHESQNVMNDKTCEEKSDSFDVNDPMTDRYWSGVNSLEEAMKEKNCKDKTSLVDAHNSVTGQSWSGANSLEASSRPADVGSHDVNTQLATRPSPIAHDSGEPTSNENTIRLPSQLISSQHELISLLNPIIANHLPSPVLMSLQNDSATILRGFTQAQLNWIQQQIIQSLTNNASQPSQPSNQGTSASNINGTISSLAQGHPFVAPFGHTQNFPSPNMMHHVPGQALNFPPPMNSIDTTQHRFVTPVLFPPSTQGYNPPVQQTVSRLSASNLQLLMRRHSEQWQMSVNQAQAQQQAMYYDEVTLSGYAGTPATTSTPSSSSEDHSVAILGPNGDTTATATSSTSSEDQAMPASSRKRARSPSQET